MIRTLLATLTVAAALLLSRVEAAQYISSETLNIPVPAGWTVVSVSEPYAFQVFVYVRVYLVNYATGQFAIWRISLTQP